MKFVRRLVWGDLPHHEVKKSGLLAALFALIIGSFWLLGSLQEPIFYHVVGRAYHAQANVLSFFFIFPVLLAYLFFLGHLRKHTIFLCCTLFYAAFFCGAALLLLHPTIGLTNTQAHAHRILGWTVYAVTKTYGSVLVTIFWSFATSLTSFNAAKRTFPFIFFFGQIGSIIGASCVRWGSSWGISPLYGIAVVCMGVIALLISYLHAFYPLVRRVEAPSRTGMLEGLRLLVASSYLRSLLVISTGFLVITAFMDYQMHFLAHAVYPTIESFAVFKGWYGQIVNGVTMIMTLGGAAVILRSLRLRVALFIYPGIAGCLVLFVYFYPSFWPLVCAMIVMRSLSFGIHNPTKEVLYINQSSDVRFKTKGWIDMIGYRLAFAGGSHLVYLFSGSFSSVVSAGLWVSVLVLCIWIFCIDVVCRTK